MQTIAFSSTTTTNTSPSMPFPRLLRRSTCLVAPHEAVEGIAGVQDRSAGAQLGVPDGVVDGAVALQHFAVTPQDAETHLLHTPLKLRIIWACNCMRQTECSYVP